MKILLGLLLAGKMSKFLLTGGTMLLSIFTYGVIYGWRYAVGIVSLLFAHEMGHYIAAQQRNLKVGVPCFIPFVGAWIALKEQPMDAETEAYVGIAGPMLGTAATFVCYLLARSWESPLLLAVSYTGFMLNLFNLIPLSPLDGGRIVTAISPRIWFVGVPVLVGLFIWKPSPMLLMIAILATPQLLAVYRNKSVLQDAYYHVPRRVRINYAFQYFVLAGFLAVTVFELHDALATTHGR